MNKELDLSGVDSHMRILWPIWQKAKLEGFSDSFSLSIYIENNYNARLILDDDGYACKLVFNDDYEYLLFLLKMNYE